MSYTSLDEKLYAYYCAKKALTTNDRTAKHFLTDPENFEILKLAKTKQRLAGMSEAQFFATKTIVVQDKTYLTAMLRCKDQNDLKQLCSN